MRDLVEVKIFVVFNFKMLLFQNDPLKEMCFQ